jgi:hypothetical protein
MNRSTIVALLAFAVLLAVVLVMRSVPRGSEEHALRVAGWKKAAGESGPGAAGGADARPEAAAQPGAAEGVPTAPAPGKEEPAPIDRIEIARGSETIVLEKQDGGENKWKITKPLEAQADWFRVRPIVDAFKEPRESSVSKSVQPDDLRLFKLDEQHRIRVKLMEQGKVFADLVVGAIEKADDEAAGPAMGPSDRGDTWVMKPGEEGRAYRLPGVDLRTPVDHTLSELRSKKVFDRDKTTVNRIILENPDDAQYPRVVIVREPAPAAPEGGEGGDGAAAPGATWRFETPAGFRPGAVDSFLGSVLGLYATDFLGADDAEAKAALADSPARLTLETADGAIAMRVSPPGESFGYVQVEGADEIVKVSQYTAKSLRKTLSELRDRKVFDVSAEAIRSLHVVSPEGDVKLSRPDGRWTAEQPAGLEVSQKAADTLARDVAGLTVAEWAGAQPPARTGLDAPTRKVTLTTAGGPMATLLLGKEEDGKVWGTLEGSPEPFRMTTFVAQKLDRSADDLRDRAVFGFAPDAVQSVELRPPGAATGAVLTRSEDGAGWQLVEGDTTTDANAESARALLTTLVTLETKDVTKKTAAEAGLGDAAAFQIVATTRDGARHTLWLGDVDAGAVYARSDAPRWAGQVFTVGKPQADKLRQPSTDLTKPPAPPAGLPAGLPPGMALPGLE